MNRRYQALRLKQLTGALETFEEARHRPRPLRGWLRAIRETLGISQEQVANAMGVKRQSIMDFEAAEANDRITLQNLRRVAGAMGCDLVYAIVPKSGSLTELAERQARSEATKRILSLERTMALENQAVGNTKEMIDQETKWITEKS